MLGISLILMSLRVLMTGCEWADQNPPMTANPHELPKRRWFQFRLSTLLWVMLTLSLACALFMEMKKAARLQDELTRHRLLAEPP